VADVLGAVFLVLAVTCAQRDNLLLPVLESLRLIKVLHAIETAANERASILLLAQVLANTIP